MTIRRTYIQPLSRFLGGVFGVLSFSSLIACSSASNEILIAPACPKIQVPHATADLYAFDGQGIDITHTAYHAQISGVNGDCRVGPHDAHKRPLTRVRVGLSINVKEGPAANKNKLEVPYFIAIMRHGKIIDKKIFTDEFDVKSSHGMLQTHTPLRFIDLPTGNNELDNDYTLAVGLQLTHEQLDYNRSHLLPAHFEKTGH
ncbi:hypothetical protein GT348_05420 [Aristophania vespae]|uniref:Lipoprotein n=1 Tax=Aristophania vespae TaxID=2697033 RepID=A0A6P1NBN4_9PROT|nr:hypothetical protein [Aristophania vespae]QHI95766.1 hypothetical protein GT348_05420 [Aristophania vespae]